MGFAEQSEKIGSLKNITFGPCRWQFAEPVSGSVAIKNIMLKTDALCRTARCGTPGGVMAAAEEMSGYLRMLGAVYGLGFAYMRHAGVLYNLKCFLLMLKLHDRLRYV